MNEHANPRPDLRVKLRGAFRAGMVGLAALAALVACDRAPPQALGTLEYDRIALPAPASERILEVAVREGQAVKAGDVVVVLDTARGAARTAAAQARLDQQREALAELEAGTRGEQLSQARAAVAAARARAEDAAATHARLRPLGERRLVAASDVDSARAAQRSADAALREAQARLQELEHGPRSERIAQARAAVQAAEAELDEQRDTAGRLLVVAPRAGRIDSLPYEPGDQPPVGAPLATVLVGAAPYARVYVPAPLRAGVEVGTIAEVRVEGRDAPLRGHVRAIRSEPGFTPYYALAGDDAARLTFLAEIALEGADDLPAGLPLQVRFQAAASPSASPRASP